MVRNPWLLAGGALSIAAAVAHLACIFGGANWYRALGAGERIARTVEAGRVMPHVLTMGIAAALLCFAAYAWSGAGLIGRLPLLRWGVLAVTAVYLVRGAFLFVPQDAWRPDLSPAFKTISSAIVLAIGLIHLAGVWRGWGEL